MSLKNSKKIVIKIGSSLLVDENKKNKKNKKKIKKIKKSNKTNLSRLCSF